MIDIFINPIFVVFVEVMAVRLACQRGLLSSLLYPPSSLSAAASLRNYSTSLPEKEKSEEEKSQSLTKTESEEAVAADVVSGVSGEEK